MLNDPKMMRATELEVLIYQHFSENSVDNAISTHSLDHLTVFMEQCNKEKSRKNSFYTFTTMLKNTHH